MKSSSRSDDQHPSDEKLEESSDRLLLASDPTPAKERRQALNTSFKSLGAVVLGKQMTVYRSRLKKMDIILAILAVASIVIAFIENEIFISEIVTDGVLLKAKHQSNYLCYLMRIANLAIAVIMDVLLILRAKQQNNLFQLENGIPKTLSLHETNLLKYLLMEIVLCSIVSPPGVDFTFSGRMLDGVYTYSVDDLVNVFAMLKLYILLRLYLHFSPWTKMKAGEKGKIDQSYSFTLRSDLKYRPFLVLGTGITILTIYSAVIVRTFERSFKKADFYNSPDFDFDYFINSIWLMVITTTTVGYGDFYPKTHMGRMTAVAICLLGMMMVSLIVIFL